MKKQFKVIRKNGIGDPAILASPELVPYLDALEIGQRIYLPAHVVEVVAVSAEGPREKQPETRNE